MRQRYSSSMAVCAAWLIASAVGVPHLFAATNGDRGGGDEPASLWGRIRAMLSGDEASLSTAEQDLVPLSTPRGIVLVEVVKGKGGSSRPDYVATRLGTETGDPLFFPKSDDPNTWGCTGHCSETFTPFLAPRDAQVVGNWSLIQTHDAQQQWAYQGKPLFKAIDLRRFDADIEEELGQETPANRSSSAAADESEKPSGDLGKAVHGMTLALFDPGKYLPRPSSISVKDLPVVGGQALADGEGKTLYVFNGDEKEQQRACPERACATEWVAVEAPLAATSIGDFAPVRRTNGVVQWAYRGKPLYTFREDITPHDAKGTNVSGYWRVALITRDFRPAGVRTVHLAGVGHMLATQDGLPLYSRYPYVFRWGGRNSYNGFIYNPYRQGKLLGAGGCDEQCLKTWKPLLAPADAQPTGYWEIVARSDGSRQWAYKGYVVYTNALDAGPGSLAGNDLYEPLIGAKVRYSLDEGLASKAGAEGLYWHVVKP